RLLVQAGVCACRAGRFAVETGLQAFLKALRRLVWMSAENLCYMFHEVGFLFIVDARDCPSRDVTTVDARDCPSRDVTTVDARDCPSRDVTTVDARDCPSR